MADAFGFETPKEALARINNRFAEANARITELGNRATPGAQAGQALANIFGRSVKKRLDTRRARKSETDRLVERTGLSPKEARQLAKQNVPLEHQEVRQALQIQEATGDATVMMEKLLSSGLSEGRARAAGMTVAAVKLRRFGFPDRATEMSLEAAKLREAEDNADLAKEQLKADLAGRIATTDNLTNTPIMKLADQEEDLLAKIDDESDPTERDNLQRKLGHVQGAIAKANFVSYSDADLERLVGDKSQDKVRLELLDGEILDNRLGSLEEMLLEHKGNLASTAVGRGAAGMAQFLENYLGLPPETIGADTLIADVNEIAGSSGYVSAAIRHALTGAAMSAQEAVLLEPFLALPAESISAKLAKIAVVRLYTQLDMETREAFLENPVKARRWLNEKNREFTKQRKEAATQDKQATDVLSTLEQRIAAKEAEGND